jgi:hypothetical protein
VAQRVPVGAKEERVRLDLVHRQSLLRPGHHPIQIRRLSKSVQRRVDEGRARTAGEDPPLLAR